MTTPIPGRVSLQSTTLASAGYDVGQRTLQLDFHDGSRYVYSGVTSDLYHELLTADSRGCFFNRHIRGHFPYAKVSSQN